MSVALVIAIPVLLIFAAVMIFATGRRRASTDVTGNVTGTLTAETRSRDADSNPDAGDLDDGSSDARDRADETKEGADGVPALRNSGEVTKLQPASDDEIQISRRQFFNRGILITMSISLGAFGAACISFLYAKSAGGFGGKVDVSSSLDDVLAFTTENKIPFYVPAARTYLLPFPTAAVGKAKKVPQYALLIPGMQQGIIASYQKCPHLGCKVPWCPSSQWFECPCHGSKYNRVGEKTGGPAPRGMDHFMLDISTGKITIDTSTPIEGAPIGTDTTGQGAEGPPCVGG